MNIIFFNYHKILVDSFIVLLFFFFFSSVIKLLLTLLGPVSLDCRIHRLHLYRGIKHTPKECPVALSTDAVEYTDCICAEGKVPHNEYPRYDTNLMLRLP